ncbi:hypothetical protein RND81_08G098700 [Saponaria officinalis]|uniref:Reverse transcriptase zinc-binding domain-containing protein n=1 Tax=Saponaria officinalis TaxID=3572 RepID=A0AAW1J4T6_SAPOF
MASGLAMNKTKSCLYANGVGEQELKRILAVTGMSHGQLPFRYLGVPISAKKLSVVDCSILVNKIVDLIRALGSRHLSYGGRLVLVWSVFSTLHSSWSRIFIIPKSIIKQIDDVCWNFLWKGIYLYSSPPLVAWDQVCKEKKCGGLSIVSAYEWNIESVAKYVWWLANKKDHLWVRWVNDVYLKGKSWRSLTVGPNMSWSWKRICQVKEKMESGYVGDWWVALGGEYSVQKGYSWLRPGDGDPVSWRHFVWNRLALPKQSFMSWIIVQNRLLTKCRMVHMGAVIDLNCAICGNDIEDQQHLFFRCEFSSRCITLLAQKLGILFPFSSARDWWMTYRFGSLFQKKFVRAAIVALSYYIWRARNYSFHEGVLWRPKMVVKKAICDVITRCTCKVSSCIVSRCKTWLESL